MLRQNCNETSWGIRTDVTEHVTSRLGGIQLLKICTTFSRLRRLPGQFQAERNSWSVNLDWRCTERALPPPTVRPIARTHVLHTSTTHCTHPPTRVVIVRLDQLPFSVPAFVGRRQSWVPDVVARLEVQVHVLGFLQDPCQEVNRNAGDLRGQVKGHAIGRRRRSGDSSRICIFQIKRRRTQGRRVTDVHL